MGGIEAPLIERDRGPWQLTLTGRIHLFDPSPDEIEIDHIITALGRVYRFSGASPITVLEHSVRLAWLMERDHQPRSYVLAALLHDASEAYLQDIPTVLKHSQGMEPYRLLEANLMSVIAEKFGFAWPLPEYVDVMDKRLGKTECVQFFPHVANFHREHHVGIEVIPSYIFPVNGDGISSSGIPYSKWFRTIFDECTNPARMC